MRAFRRRFASVSSPKASGLSGHFQLNVESLEDRLVPTISAGFAAGLLTVTGDSSANAIAISFATVSSSKYVMVNSSSGLLFDGRPSASNVLTSNITSISVGSGDGGDYIDLTDVSTANGFAGLDGDITLQGGNGVDGFAGSAFGDLISAFGGNDVIEGRAGNDSIDGGSGDDTYIYYGTALGSDLITEASSDGADTITFALFAAEVTVDLSSTASQSIGGSTSVQFSSSTGVESIIGTVYGDAITGNARDNIIIGGGGNDTMAGGSGSDTYSFYSDPSGADTITEAANSDSDMLDFSGCDVGVTIDISSTSSQSWGDGSIVLSSSTGIENFTGSNYNDSFTGNSRNNVIIGNPGNDTLAGGSGDDYYVFGAAANGSDVITESAYADEDTLFFNLADVGVTIDLSSTSSQSWGDGSLQFSSGAGIDNVFGSQYADSITGNDGNNSLVGGSGNDTLIGGDGDDSLVGEDGDDSLVGGSGSDIYNFEAIAQGADAIVEAANLDVDSLIFENSDVAITMDLSSTSSQPWGDGTITLSSSAGIEAIQGGAFNDSLTGNSENNVIFGGGGNDTMAGGGGNDVYAFGAVAQGSDVITESANADTDCLDFSPADVAVSIDISNTSSQSWGDGTISLSTSTSIEVVFGSLNNDTIIGNSRQNDIFGLAGNDSLEGGTSDDYLYGNDGNDTIKGEDGNDFLAGGSGNDSLIGGDGDDFYYFTGEAQGADSITEAAGIDEDTLSFVDARTSVVLDISSVSTQNWGDGSIILSSSTGIDDVTGSNYADSLTGNSISNIISGGSGNDTIAGGDGADAILGDDGNDSINGGDGDDLVYGLDGSDTISGGDGRDIIAGGAGADSLMGDGGDDVLGPGEVDSVYGALAVYVGQAVWVSADNYNDRVGNITGDAGAPNPLPTGFRFVKNETVFDDSSGDTLVGGSGNDLFFYDNGEDTLTDLALAEFSIDIG